MDPDIDFVDESLPPTICPYDLVREMFYTVAETTRLVADSINDAKVPESIGRSIAAVIEANETFVDQFAEPARRSAPPSAPRARRGSARTTRTAASTPDDAPASLRLRGQPGSAASAAFLLHNLRPEVVKATVLATPLVDAAGDLVDMRLTLEPARVELLPGQEIVVMVTTTIPSTLTPGQLLQGAIHVPGLATATVSVVVLADLPQPS